LCGNYLVNPAKTRPRPNTGSNPVGPPKWFRWASTRAL